MRHLLRRTGKIECIGQLNRTTAEVRLSKSRYINYSKSVEGIIRRLIFASSYFLTYSKRPIRNSVRDR